MQPDLSRIRHVALDMDGTIYRGSRLFACTLPFLARLCDAGIGYTFLTNNTSLSKADYVRKLRALGIDAAKSRSTRRPIPPSSTCGDRHPGALDRWPCSARRRSAAQFEQAGFTVTWDAPAGGGGRLRHDAYL